MSEIGLLHINILVDRSLSGIMTSKRVIHESESPWPAASSILISRMTRSLVIIPYHHMPTVYLGKSLNCSYTITKFIKILI